MAAPHSLPDTATAQRKAALRARALEIRAGLDPGLGAAAARHILDSPVVPPGAAVAGTWPLAAEMDLRPLWHALHARGHTILLPQTPPRGQALIFRVWSPACVMITEPFGTRRPDGPAGTPDLLIVPFLAFDARGHRLGYGGGYYDRTLAALPDMPAIGVGYGALRVDSLPVDQHDRPLDRIYTEDGLAYSRAAD